MSDKRRMCPNCRAFITTSDRTCPYCNQHVGPRAIDVRQPGEIAGGLIPQAHFTTLLILLINLGMFLGQTQFGNGVLTELGAKEGYAIFREHEYWRLVTAGFLHGGWLHILMNSWSLYNLGAVTEIEYGTPRFLVGYFVSTVSGFWLSAVIHPDIPSLGASAGISGLVGMMLAFGIRNPSSWGRQVRNVSLINVANILAIGFIFRFIDNSAHIGGLVGGFLVGYLAGTPVRSSTAREGAWRVAAALCVMLTLVSFFEIYRNFPTPGQLR